MAKKKKRGAGTDPVLAREVTAMKEKITQRLAGFDGFMCPRNMFVAQAKSNGRNSKKNLLKALNELYDEGRVSLLDGMLFLCMEASVTKLMKTAGIVTRNADGLEFFVPGKFLMGALIGDTVMIAPIYSSDGEPKAQVVRIVKESDSRITGIALCDEYGDFYLMPDNMGMNMIRLVKSDCPFEDESRVLAEIVSRGVRHSEHVARVIVNYGNSGNAAVCAKAIIAAAVSSEGFSPETLAMAKEIDTAGISGKDCAGRLDLRGKNIFTVDGADSKDMDDAVSAEKTDSGYELGVHIADVSHYVKAGSSIDREAMERGTSIYYADKVIPMLPAELSNGICSLNPGEDRLAFSALMKFDFEGNILDYQFRKTVIFSRVKGIYSEINDLFAKGMQSHFFDKYSQIYGDLTVMKELAEVLINKRASRGAPDFGETETIIKLDKNDKCIDVKAKI
ncbi:MAG: RNB domain-containing ribonuclease, partial [Oscillospiraceae bacterium]|nr:RNB domain-containing ribonuclease [Oscillospiraceae bacterium]